MLYERKSQSRKALFLVFLTDICYNSVMIYNIADLKVKINNKYSFTDKLCADYLSENQDSSDIEVTAGAEEIAKEKALSPNFPDGYIENICLYREICNRMPVRNRFLLHSAVVEYGGAAYAFLGRSGTGKSTHTGIWLKNLPSAKILNGDKPIIGYAGGEFTVYGTPWQGKERLGYNGKAPLKGLCFLEQAKKNEIARLSPGQAAERLFVQILLPDDPEAVGKTLELCDELVKTVPSYLLKCDISDEAFEKSFAALTKGEPK